MKIAIVGSFGYIASFLLKAFAADAQVEHVLRIDQTEDADARLDLTHAEDFDYSCLKGIDQIVFTAAVSGPDACANRFEECWQINVTGTSLFMETALAMGCRVLFFSSDAVFGSDERPVYDERSETRAETAYGRMKKAVEDAFRGNPGFKAIRLSYVASAKDRFVSYCLKCMRSGETAEVFHPFYRNCIAVSDVVRVVQWLMNHWTTFEPQALNIAGDELVSRVRIADELNRVFDNRLQYTIVTPGADFYKNRPRITHIRSLYLAEYGILENKSFTEKLRTELEGIEI